MTGEAAVPSPSGCPPTSMRWAKNQRMIGRGSANTNRYAPFTALMCRKSTSFITRYWKSANVHESVCVFDEKRSSVFVSRSSPSSAVS